MALLAGRARASTRLQVAGRRHLSGAGSKSSGASSGASGDGAAWQKRGALDRLRAGLDDATIARLSGMDAQGYEAWWRARTGRAGSAEETAKSWDLRRDSAYGF